MHSEAQAHEIETASSQLPDSNHNMTTHKKRSEATRAHDFVAEHGDLSWTASEEKKLLLKLDLWVIPLTFVAGFLTYADAGAYGVAALFGLIKDLGLYDIVSINPLVTSLTKYSWTTSITLFGSMISYFPILLLAQKFSAGKLYGFLTLYSGVFALLMLAPHNFAGTMAVRFFYGIQNAVLPLFVIYSSSWWTQQEQPIRIAIISTGSAVGSLIGQAIDLAAVRIGGVFAASPWKWMYVILGSITTAWGILYIVLIPESPTKTRWFTDRERAIAIARVRSNGTGMQSTKFELGHALKALTDLQLWALIIVSFASQFAAAAVGSFGGLLTASFGYQGEEALKFLLPASAVAMVVILISGALATYVPNSRIWTAIGCFVITILGNLLLWRSPRTNRQALLAGLYLSIFFFGSAVQGFALLASNIGGSSKKTVATAFVFVISSVGGIVAPFAYKGEEAAQGFPTGIITVMVLMIASVVALIALRIHYMRYNRKADRAMQASGITSVKQQEELAPETGFDDVSERDVSYFRYQL